MTTTYSKAYSATPADYPKIVGESLFLSPDHMFPATVPALIHTCLGAGDWALPPPLPEFCTAAQKIIETKPYRLTAVTRHSWLLKGMKTRYPNHFLMWLFTLGLNHQFGLPDRDTLAFLRVNTVAKISKNPLVRLAALFYDFTTSPSSKLETDLQELTSLLVKTGFHKRECKIITDLAKGRQLYPCPPHNARRCQDWLNDNTSTWRSHLILAAAAATVELNQIRSGQIIRFVGKLRRWILEGKVLPLDSINLSDADFDSMEMSDPQERQLALENIAFELLYGLSTAPSPEIIKHHNNPKNLKAWVLKNKQCFKPFDLLTEQVKESGKLTETERGEM